MKPSYTPDQVDFAAATMDFLCTTARGHIEALKRKFNMDMDSGRVTLIIQMAGSPGAIIVGETTQPDLDKLIHAITETKAMSRAETISAVYMGKKEAP